MVSMMMKVIEEDTSLDWTEDNMWNLINALVKESGAGRGKVVTPLRHALTGRKVGHFCTFGKKRKIDFDPFFVGNRVVLLFLLSWSFSAENGV